MDNLSVCINKCLHLFHEMCSANFCAKYRKIKETTDFLHINRNSLFSRVCSLSLATCLSLSLSIPFPSLSFSQFPSSLSLSSLHALIEAIFLVFAIRFFLAKEVGAIFPVNWLIFKCRAALFILYGHG